MEDPPSDEDDSLHLGASNEETDDDVSVEEWSTQSRFDNLEEGTGTRADKIRVSFHCVFVPTFCFVNGFPIPSSLNWPSICPWLVSLIVLVVWITHILNVPSFFVQSQEHRTLHRWLLEVGALDHLIGLVCLVILTLERMHNHFKGS